MAFLSVRVRLVLCGVLTGVVAAGAVVSAQTLPGRETTAASVASYRSLAIHAGGPGTHDGLAAERVALLRAREREARPSG